MPKTRRAQTILLLADGFEEAAVGVIVARLRQEGLPLNLVGLRSKQVNGAHGLVIAPDMSLDRLLETAAPIAALIVPGGSNHLARLRVDPRVGVLLKRCVEEQAMLVGLDGQAADIAGLVAEVDSPISWLILEPGQPVEQFATTVIRRLVTVQK